MELNFDKQTGRKKFTLGESGLDRIPNLFLIGVPKCGTTALCEQLSQHPEIFIPERKELNFFNTDIRGGPDKYRITDDASYLALYFGKSEKYCGDGSVTYLYSRSAPQKIRCWSPDAKLLVILRNPFDLVSSMYHFRLFNGGLIAPDLEDCLDQEEQYFAAHDTSRDAIDNRYQFAGYGKYADGIRRYQSLFGRENLHVIIYEELVRDRLAGFKKIFEYLDVESDFSPLNTIINKTMMKKSDAVHEILSRIFQLPGVRYTAQKMPKRIRHRLYSMVVGLNAVSEERPPLTKRVRDRLMPGFRQDIEKLAALIDRDLSFWLVS